MNQLFNFNRFCWLMKRQWYENAVIYMWGISFMFVAYAFMFWLSSNWKAISNPHLGQMETFSIVGMFFLYMYGANFFDSLKSKHKSMFYFSLPVSSLERTAVAFTYTMVLLPALLLSVFSMFDFIFVQLFNHIHGVSVQMFFNATSPVGAIKFMPLMIWVYVSYTSLFTLGSLMFGKNGRLAILVFTIISALIFFWLRVLVSGSESIIDFINSGVFSLMIPICWILVFYVMKRKEA